MALKARISENYRLLRCGKSCRLRWINYLRPDVKRGNFTKEEEDTIIKLHETLGNRWSKIASELPGRTDNEIKNVWHTHLKKKLLNNSSDNNYLSTNNTDQSKQLESSCITSSSSSSSSTGHQAATTLIPQKTTDNINKECSTYQSADTPICKLQDDHHQLDLVAVGSSMYQRAGPDDDDDNNNYSNTVLNEVVDKPSNSDGLLEIPLEADDDFWNMLDDDNIGGGSFVSNDDDHHHHEAHSDAETLKYWIREIEKDLGLEPQASSSDLTIGLSDIDIWPNIGSSGF